MRSVCSRIINQDITHTHYTNYTTLHYTTLHTHLLTHIHTDTQTHTHTHTHTHRQTTDRQTDTVIDTHTHWGSSESLSLSFCREEVPCIESCMLRRLHYDTLYIQCIIKASSAVLTQHTHTHTHTLGFIRVSLFVFL